MVPAGRGLAIPVACRPCRRHQRRRRRALGGAAPSEDRARCAATTRSWRSRQGKLATHGARHALAAAVAARQVGDAEQRARCSWRPTRRPQQAGAPPAASVSPRIRVERTDAARRGFDRRRAVGGGGRARAKGARGHATRPTSTARPVPQRRCVRARGRRWRGVRRSRRGSRTDAEPMGTTEHGTSDVRVSRRRRTARRPPDRWRRTACLGGHGAQSTSSVCAVKKRCACVAGSYTTARAAA